MKALKVLGWIFIPYIMILIFWKKLGQPIRSFALAWAVVALLIGIFANSSGDDSSTTVARVKPSPSAIASAEIAATTTPEPTATPSEAAAAITPSPEAAAPATAAATAAAVNPQTIDHEVILYFPADKYPDTAAHIAEAIAAGESAVCTIDRDEADTNRDESLDGIPTKDGFDRDEWPMAMCDEGGTGADVEYVEPSDNRGAGSWVGNQLEAYTDGTRVLFVIEGGKSGTVVADGKNPATVAPTKAPKKSPTMKPTATPEPTKESVQETTEIVYYKNCTAVRAAGADPIRIGDPGYAKHLDRDGDGIGCE